LEIKSQTEEIGKEKSGSRLFGGLRLRFGSPSGEKLALVYARRMAFRIDGPVFKKGSFATLKEVSKRTSW